MRTTPRRQDGIAALRQRLFFARELLKMAEREAAGTNVLARGAAMALRQSAVLQLHAVYTGLLDDAAQRLRVDEARSFRSHEALERELAVRGLASPEVARVRELIAAGGWLADCAHEWERCLSCETADPREGDDHHHDEEHGAGLAIRVTAAPEACVLDAADFARLRGWVQQWGRLLDEFVVTLEEF